MLLLQGDDGAKKDPASSANPGVLEAEIEKQAEAAKTRQPRKGREARVPEHLPTVEEVIEPETVKAAPEAWRCMGEEITEQLDYEPARFLRRRIIRRKYVKREEPHLPPIMARLHQALSRLKLSRHHLPKSAFGRAMDYALSLWPMLSVYAEDGRVEIDNNPVENAIRPTAIGKKNWLFIGDADAGQRSAILYTIIESCRARGLDPWAYLREVLTRLPSMTNRQVKDVTPKAWAKTQSSNRKPHSSQHSSSTCFSRCLA